MQDYEKQIRINEKELETSKKSKEYKEEIKAGWGIPPFSKGGE